MDNTNLLHLIDRFADLKVLVIGEAMLDVYLKGKSERLCREAPVPVVTLTESVWAAGGAANCAVNVASLGGQALFLSVVGDDPEGDMLKSILEARGVPVDHLLVHPGRCTLAKNRVMATSQLLVRFDQGSTDSLDPKMEEALIERVAELYPECDALILSDYDYGIFTPRLIQALANLQAADEKIIVADSRQLDKFRELHVTAVKPNYAEAVQMLGLDQASSVKTRAEQIAAHGQKILDLSGAQVAAVTLDLDGALIFERESAPATGFPAAAGAPYRTYARPAPHSRAAGAGDTFVSTLALSLAAGAYTPAAAELASAAASIVVSKEDTAACFAEELRAHFFTDEKYVGDVFGLAARISSYCQSGKRIVFTNGCFDILHRGHITYLNKAKSLGDVLVVGVNSDDSVRRLKGPTRPINPLEDRAQVLSALSCIDHIIAFDADTPHELIRVIKPDVFVKGGDYTRDTLPEASLVEQQGGQVEILPYLDDRSTTSIIERIRLADDWTAGLGQRANGRVKSLERK